MTPSSKAICEVNIAVTYKHADGEETFWTRVVIWGKSAEFVGRYARKGDLLVCHNFTYVVRDDPRDEEKKVHQFVGGYGSRVEIVAKTGE